MNNKRAVFDLFLISALGLFTELIFIRWAASELRLLAFYKNFALIAAFLGLGLGFAIRRKASQPPLFERWYFPLLAFNVLIILLLGRTPLFEYASLIYGIRSLYFLALVFYVFSYIALTRNSRRAPGASPLPDPT